MTELPRSRCKFLGKSIPESSHVMACGGVMMRVGVEAAQPVAGQTTPLFSLQVAGNILRLKGGVSLKKTATSTRPTVLLGAPAWGGGLHCLSSLCSPAAWTREDPLGGETVQ